MVQAIKFPDRVQRKRKKGYKHPPKTRYCGRGTIYGNPFKPGEVYHNSCFYYEKKDLVSLYGQELDVIIAELGMTEEEFLSPLLAYKHLSCFCHKDEPCHVDVLIERLKRFFTPQPPRQLYLL